MSEMLRVKVRGQGTWLLRMVEGDMDNFLVAMSDPDNAEKITARVVDVPEQISATPSPSSPDLNKVLNAPMACASHIV